MAAGTTLKSWAWWTLRWGVAGIFVYAGVVKAIDPETFAWDIRRYRLVPTLLATGLSYYFPWLEILCGLAVGLRRWERGALLLLLGLLGVFLGAILQAWFRGLVVQCGCFGARGPALYPLLVGRDLVLLIVVGGLWWAAQLRLVTERMGVTPRCVGSAILKA